jgi:hypothetical protein
MLKAKRDLALGGVVGSQFVRNDLFGHEVPAFYRLDQKPLCGALVSSRLKDFLKNDAVLINRAPQPV